MTFFLILLAVALAALNVTIAFVAPGPITIGCAVFTVGMALTTIVGSA